MKKKFIKSTLAVAILTVAGLGGMKVYENHNTFNGDDLLSLNIEALSWNETNQKVNLVDPLKTSTCYHRERITTIPAIITPDTTSNDTIYQYTYHWITYTIYGCTEYPFDQAPLWFSDCTSDLKTECGENDPSVRPANYGEEWIIQYDHPL